MISAFKVQMRSELHLEVMVGSLGSEVTAEGHKVMVRVGGRSWGHRVGSGSVIMPGSRVRS